MNIIFGKTQISLRQIGNENSGFVKSKVLCASKFRKIFGLGPRKTQWMLSSIGASQNLRINNFFSKRPNLNREKKLEKAMYRSCLRYIGSDLKQAFFLQKRYSKQFSRVNTTTRRIISKGKKKVKKLRILLL